MNSKIFCLEGEWHANDLRDQSTVETYLRFLKETFGIDYLYRKVNTREAFFKYLEQLGKYSKSRYKDYSIIYLAFHGDKKKLWLDEIDAVEIDELSEINSHPLTDRIVHFGSCRTLKMSFEDLKEFWNCSQAKAVSGFSKNIDFMEASLFDIAYLHKLCSLKHTGKIFNFMNEKFERLSNDLGFVYIDKYNPK